MYLFQTLILVCKHTSRAKVSFVFSFRLPPKPRIKPKANNDFSCTPCKCDKPLRTVPINVVSTTKSF
jgi:hypothetical protein